MKKKVIISLILEFAILALIISYCTYAAIENGLTLDDTPSLITVGSGVNEAEYVHDGKFIRRDGESEIRYITTDQYEKIKEYLDDAYGCWRRI